MNIVEFLKDLMYEADDRDPDNYVVVIVDGEEREVSFIESDSCEGVPRVLIVVS